MRKARERLVGSAPKKPGVVHARDDPEQNKASDRSIWVMLVAAMIFYFMMLLAGPTSFVDAMPDLDLGSGITMTDTGQIKISNPVSAAPPRIPAESEYGGIVMP